MLKFINMPNITLSYILTTYNKLPFLKESLGRAISNIQPDEEIVVTDGGSTDGTREYLEDLYRQGKIHQFVSERDFGESHGTNKALLLARGNIIKLLTDDDVFNFQEIRRCRDFLIHHPEIDFLSTNGVTVHWDTPSVPRLAQYTNDFISHREQKKPFGFCGLGWMWRKNSLPLLGFMNPSFIRMDAEYSLRITASKARIAWYTGIVWARLLHPYSNAKKQRQQINKETKLLERLYGLQLSKTSDVLSLGKVFLWSLKQKYFKGEKKYPTFDIPSLFTAGERFLSTGKAGKFL
jgi:glycosyltransferase involved in cell wall biosynthesis